MRISRRSRRHRGCPSFFLFQEASIHHSISLSSVLIKQPGLDACLTLGTAPKWKSDAWGGHTQYLDSEEALLAFDPLPNQLSLVFRDAPDVFRFVKFCNHRAPSARFDFECTFQVDEDEDEDAIVQ